MEEGLCRKREPGKERPCLNGQVGRTVEVLVALEKKDQAVKELNRGLRGQER